MGEYAEMMLDGTLCQVCGEFMGGDTGFPRTCEGCRKQPELYRQPPKNPKVKCPTCGKKVKAVGLADHQRDAHKAVNERGRATK
jgi:hypothetical protein